MTFQARFGLRDPESLDKLEMTSSEGCLGRGYLPFS